MVSSHLRYRSRTGTAGLSSSLEFAISLDTSYSEEVSDGQAAREWEGLAKLRLRAQAHWLPGRMAGVHQTSGSVEMLS